MKIHSRAKVIFLLLISVLLFSQCAKIVTPTGGPKDEEHPLIVKIEPPDYSVNFNRKKIEITFNEFIQLKDLTKSLVISPPLEEKPDILVKGKTLVIEFNSELKDSTTYNIYFGNAVQDYNEGNPIENFQYVLSTGPYVDSLSIKGQIINSYNLLPEEGVYVMLYQELDDSVPMKKLPLHIAKTNKEGNFQINNISHNKFKLFCLRDINKNYLFDLPNEDIAFIDSLVSFNLVTETKIDTIFKSDSTSKVHLDSTETIKAIGSKRDSLLLRKEKEIDTIIVQSTSYYPVRDYILRLFTEDHKVQYLANNTRNTRQKIEVVFNKAIKDSVTFDLVDTTINKPWYIKEVGVNQDSIIYWITDSTIYNKENLSFALTYQKEDSNMVYQWNTDTLKLKFYEETGGRRKKKEPKDTSLKYELNVKDKGTFDLNSKLNFSFDTPVFDFDTSKIKLFAVVDTLELPVKYSLSNDSIYLRKYNMSVDWCEDTVYRLEIYPHAFNDIYGAVNDTNIMLFQTQKRDYYGKILANVTGVDSSFQLICQLILPNKDSEKIYEQKIITKNQIVDFDYLPPKEFMFKVVIDKNFNGKWDTGEYLKHNQPEEVLYYDKKIKVRSNWDMEINFSVNK